MVRSIPQTEPKRIEAVALALMAYMFQFPGPLMTATCEQEVDFDRYRLYLTVGTGENAVGCGSFIDSVDLDAGPLHAACEIARVVERLRRRLEKP